MKILQIAHSGLWFKCAKSNPKFHLGLEQNAPSALFIGMRNWVILKVLKARPVKAQNAILGAMICIAQNAILGIRQNPLYSRVLKARSFSDLKQLMNPFIRNHSLIHNEKTTP